MTAFQDPKTSRLIVNRMAEIRSGVSISTLVLAMLALSDPVYAACAGGTICVTQTTDTGDVNAQGSLSWAIAQANASGNQTIAFDPAAFTGGNPTLQLTGTAQTPRIAAGVTIDGTATPGLKIDGGGQREIFFARPDAPDAASPIQVTIKNVTLANGRAKGGDGGGGGYGGGGGMGAGGAIFVGKGVALTTENVTLSGNTAQGGNGGGTNADIYGSGGGGTERRQWRKRDQRHGCRGHRRRRWRMGQRKQCRRTDRRRTEPWRRLFWRQWYQWSGAKWWLRRRWWWRRL